MSNAFIRHIYTLIFRVALLCMAIFLYATGYLYLTQFNFARVSFSLSPIEIIFLIVVWVVLVVGMLGRLIPNKYVAMGARKHYGNNGEGRKLPIETRKLHKGAGYIAIAWVIFNGLLFFVLSQFRLLNIGITIIIVLFYSICDLVFILFFCPFQKFFMHNRCCVVCRIYNWDYFMMCTPLLPIFHVYSFSLVVLSIIVLIRWERAVYKNPHYFLPETNKHLNCATCKDRMCLVKKRGDRL